MTFATGGVFDEVDLATLELDYVDHPRVLRLIQEYQRLKDDPPSGCYLDHSGECDACEEHETRLAELEDENEELQRKVGRLQGEIGDVLNNDAIDRLSEIVIALGGRGVGFWFDKGRWIAETHGGRHRSEPHELLSHSVLDLKKKLLAVARVELDSRVAILRRIGEEP